MSTKRNRSKKAPSIYNSAIDKPENLHDKPIRFSYDWSHKPQLSAKYQSGNSAYMTAHQNNVIQYRNNRVQKVRNFDNHLN